VARRQRPKAFRNFNEQTIDDIVAKTGYPVADKAALFKDLLACYGKTWPQFPKRAKDTIKRQQKRWKSMRTHITRLMDLIEADNEDYGAVRELTGGASDRIVTMLRALAVVLEGRELEPVEFIRRNRERYGSVGQVIMRRLTGEWLPEIFEKYFKPLKARSSRPVNKAGYSGPPTGPYIRFAKAVLAAWQLDYSKEAIKAALRRAKKI
jgi:hypothetical protein